MVAVAATSLVDSVRSLLGSGVEYTIQSLVNRIQRDLKLSFHDADSLVWSGAGEFWTINQTTGVVSVLPQ